MPNAGNTYHVVQTGTNKAYQDATFARRAFPRGARYIWYPKWGDASWDR